LPNITYNIDQLESDNDQLEADHDQNESDNDQPESEEEQLVSRNDQQESENDQLESDMDELMSDNQPLESDDGQLDANSSDQFESDNNEESRRKEDEDIDEHDRLKNSQNAPLDKNNVLIFALKVKHKLTSEAILGIGRLVNVACNAEKVFTSKYISINILLLISVMIMKSTKFVKNVIHTLVLS